MKNSGKNSGEGKKNSKNLEL